ncbi:LOW QUALITY PROTEIN: PPR domain-containing protein/PPR_2 domain-containing protein/PPR_3 domain-containing protein, partial [Cephalotus follicularis]
TMISGFVKLGRLQDSIWFFERNPFQNVFSWTANISGFVQHGFGLEALKLFLKLLESGVKPNHITFTSAVKSCVGLGDFGLGMSIFRLILKSGFEHCVSVSNSLITFCLRMGDIDLPKRIFDKMDKRNEVSWSALIARYSQSGYPLEALQPFSEMVQCGFKPNGSCFPIVFSALASLEALQAGSTIHAHVIKIEIERDIFVSNSLIDLYCKCGKTKDGLNGQMDEAKKLFESIPVHDNVSWNSIIAGYVEYKQYGMVFEVFNEMLLSGEISNQSTFSSVLCALCMASLEKGKDTHGKIIKFGIQDGVVDTALTNMYAKSGDIQSSKCVFDRMPEKNEIPWTVMIGLAESGVADESLILFEEMKRSSVHEIMLLSVLFACAHCGLVDKGLQYFNSMEAVYGIKPQGKHYTCMVDMLSRSGRLSEAEEFINSMPFQPESNACAALLSGCWKYKNEDIAERAAKKLWERAEKNSAGYLLLSNIYASAGKWLDVLNIRELMKEKPLKKSGGCSWVEVRNGVHSF